MMSEGADGNDLLDMAGTDILNKSPHDRPNFTGDYENGKEHVHQQEEWLDLNRSHTAYLEDLSSDFKSISQVPSSKESFVDAFSRSVYHPDTSLSLMSSDSVYHPDTSLSLMSSENIADKGDTTDFLVHREAAVQTTEYVYLNRLPGENLGMVLGIEGDQENRQTIDAVVVKSVTPIGAVARSCQGSNRILVGDEIREIDGRPLNKLTHDECIGLFQEMPDNVVLTVFRQEKDNEIHVESLASLSIPKPVKRNGTSIPHSRKHYANSESCNINQEQFVEEVNQFTNRFTEVSNCEGKRQEGFNDYNVPKGFIKVDITICRKDDDDNFGLGIVPSYGTTCDLYQVKRLLHSGACAQSGLLEVGDRLLTCNGQSLKGLTQIQCLNVLKSSGALIKLTVLRHTGNKENAPPAPDAASAYTQSELTSCSNDSTDVNITENSNDGSNNISKHIREALIGNETVTDTQNQDELLVNISASKNNSFLDNFDYIQSLDTDNKISTQGDNYPSKGIVSEEKDCLLFMQIPPPGEFSDADSHKDIDLPTSQRDINVTTSSVDDLFFGTVADTASPNTDIYGVLGSTHSETHTWEPLLISLDQKPGDSDSFITLNDSCTDSTDDAFTGQSIEEFADECFSNISNTELEKVSSDTPQQSSEHVSAALANDLLHIQDEEQTSIFSNSDDHVTILSVSSTQGDDSQLFLSDVLEYESHCYPEDTSVPLSSGSNTHHVFNTHVLENSQARVSKSHVDVVSEGYFVKEEIISPAINVTHHSSSVISNSREGSSSAALTSPTVTVDESCPATAAVNSQLNSPIVAVNSQLNSPIVAVNSQLNSPIVAVNSQLNSSIVLTSVGVTNMFESGEREEAIKPIVVVKDNQDILSCIPSQQITSDPQEDYMILDNVNNPEIAEDHFALTTTSSTSIRSVTRIKELTSGEERVPTMQTTDEKENVLGVLKNWTSEISSNNAAALYNVGSGVLDTQRKLYEQPLPENAVLHTTVGVSNDGQEENVIQRMISAKDHQGRHFCIPSVNSEQNKAGVNVPDFHAKLEIADVICSLVSLQPSGSQSQQKTEQAGDLVREDDIVPTVMSYDQKKIVASALDTWIHDDTKVSKPSTVQRAAAGFKIPHKHENTTSASLYSAKSFQADISTGNIDDSKQNSHTDLHASVKEKPEVTSSLIPTDTSNSIHNTEGFAKKSTQDFDEIFDTTLTSVQPEAKQRAGLNISDNYSLESSTHQTSDHVILRNKLRQSADVNAQSDKSQLSTDTGSSFITRRPRSMIVTSSNTTSRFEDLHKSVTTESKHAPAFRPLSSLRPLSASSASILHHSNTSLNRPSSASFSSSTFSTKISKSDYPKVRQEDGSPFQVDIIKGIVGLGLKVKVTPEGNIQVTEISRGGPVDKDGHIHIGDYILFINSTEVTGQTDARVQQILRLLPRGLTKLVVSSAVPASSGSQSQIFDSSSNSFTLQTQQHMADTHQSTSSLNNDPLRVTLSQRKSHSPQTEDMLPNKPVKPMLPSQQVKPMLPTQQVKPIVSTADSLISISEDQVSERTESPPKSCEKSILVDALDNTSSTGSSKHDHFTTFVPEQDLTHVVSENHVDINEKIIFKELQHSTELHTLDVEPVPFQRKSLEDGSIVHKHGFKTNSELTNQIVAIKHTENVSNPVAHLELLDETNTVSSNNQDTSAVSSSLSYPDLLQPEDIDKPEIKSEVQERGTSVSEEKIEDRKYPPYKAPPPVAPKPHLSPAALKKPEDSVDGSQPIWPPLRKTVGDDKLKNNYQLSKSAVVDKTGSFVSSTAKMFDDKTASSHSVVNKTLVTRRVSREMAHTDNNKAINSSLSPTQDPHKNTLIKNPVSLSQSLTLSRPRTLNYTAAVSKEVTSDEGSTKIKENVDDKTNSVLSSTHLNSALSPRKKTSFDAPTSPPFSTLKKYVPPVEDESAGRLDSGKGQSVHQFDIYHTTPRTLLTNKSPSLVFSNNKSSPQPDQTVHDATSEYYNKPLTSPILSSLPTKEAQLQNTMKQFDDLLIDDELLLSTDIPQASLEVESAERFHTQTADVKKPVALPRRKVDHKPDELQVEVKESEELSQIKNKDEIHQTKETLKLEEVQESYYKCFDASDSANMTSETSNLSDKSDNVTINITEKIYESPGKSVNNIPSEITEILETSVMAESEIRQASKILDMPDKVNETNSSITADSNHEQSLHRGPGMTDTNILEVQQFHDSDHQEERTIAYEDISESLFQQSLTNSMNTEVDEHKQEEGFEARETQAEFLDTYAHQIVEDIMTRILNNPGTLVKIEKTNLTDISVCPGLFDVESPPLPDEPPPAPASPPPYLENTNLLINAEDLENQDEFPAVNEEVTKCLDKKVQSESTSMIEQFTVTNSVKLEVNTHRESLVNKTVVDSVRPLHFSDSNFYSSDVVEANLTSPLDILSEDSGMPADEDQELATDDAISPPSEFMEIGSHVVKKVPFSLKNDAELLPISSPAQEYDSLMTHSEFNSKISADDLLGDLTYDNYDKGGLENDTYDNLQPILSPTSTSISVASQHSSTNYVEDLQSQNYLPSTETSAPPLLPPEVTLLCDETSVNGSVELAQVPVSKAVPETKHELAAKYHGSATTASVLYSDSGVQDTAHLKVADIPSATVTSKRKWYLMSNRSRSPVLSGDSHSPVQVHYTEATLVSSVSPDHLSSVLMKANVVLDAASAPDSLVLIVVHVHSSDDFTPLNFDIRHQGSIWFQVSGLRENSALFEGDGIEDGDYLILVDDEWSNLATLASFQSKLVHRKHDKLLVFTRGRNDVNVKEAVLAKPVPIPRSRSLEKQKLDQQILSKTEYDDFIDAAPEHKERILSEKLPSVAQNVSLIPNQTQLLLDQDPQLPNEAPPLPDEAPPLPDEAPPLPDQSPPLPDEAPPLPSQEPPFPDQIPSLINQASPLWDQPLQLPFQAPQIPDHQPSPLEQIELPSKEMSSLLDQTSPIPDYQPPLLKQRELLLEERSSLLDQTPPIPDHQPPLLKQRVSSEQKPSLIDQTPQIPDHQPPILKQRELPSEQNSSLPNQASSLLDKILVKETPPFLEEKKETLPDKISRAVHETPKILAKTDHNTDGEDKVTMAKYKINGAQEANSKAPMKPLPEKTTPVKDNLPAVNKRSSVASSDELVAGIHKVIMMKGATGVGFCIEGGIGSPKGDVPIIIKRIFKGGPAEKCGQLKVRDEILEVNRVKFDSMRHNEAWNHLKFLDDGAVHIIIRRPSS